MQPRQKLHFAEAKLNPALGRFGDWLTDARNFTGYFAKRGIAPQDAQYSGPKSFGAPMLLSAQGQRL